jgi:uncharacterized protein involved in copper resistance
MRPPLVTLAFLCALLVGWIPVAAGVQTVQLAGMAHVEAPTNQSDHAAHGLHGSPHHQHSGTDQPDMPVHPVHCAACLAMTPATPPAPAQDARDRLDPALDAVYVSAGVIPATPPPRS